MRLVDSLELQAVPAAKGEQRISMQLLPECCWRLQFAVLHFNTAATVAAAVAAAQ